MTDKLYYGYTSGQWFKLIVCYLVFLFFGGIAASEGLYYSLMKNDLDIPYKVQGYLVTMSSWSFIIGSPLVGYLMTLIDVKPIIVTAFIAYFVAFTTLYNVKALWLVFAALFVEGFGGVLLDVGINTLSTVIFSQHRGVMMNYLHFFYGLGSTIGPMYSSWVHQLLHIGYRGIFIGLLIPCILGFFLTIFCKLTLNEPKPEKEENLIKDSKEVSQNLLSDESTTISQETKEVQITVTSSSTEEVHNTDDDDLTVLRAFFTPLVWLLGLSMGAVCAIESVTINWGPLYLQYLFNMNPETDGAHFIALFYVYYTVARLGTGFIVDKLGDTISMIVFNVLLIILYIIAFIWGRNGVWLLTMSGLLISPFYPTSITVPMQIFGEKAKNTISVILCLALVINLIIQVLIGYVNEYIGAEWGFRIMTISMSVIMIICMIIATMWLKKHEKKDDKEPSPSTEMNV